MLLVVRYQNMTFNTHNVESIISWKYSDVSDEITPVMNLQD